MPRPHVKRVPEEGLGDLTAAELVGYDNSGTNYTSSAENVDEAVTALDTQVKINADAVAGAAFDAGAIDTGLASALEHTITIPDQGTTNYTPLISISQILADAGGGIPNAGVGYIKVTVVDATSFKLAWVDELGAEVLSKEVTGGWAVLKH